MSPGDLIHKVVVIITPSLPVYGNIQPTEHPQPRHPPCPPLLQAMTLPSILRAYISKLDSTLLAKI